MVTTTKDLIQLRFTTEKEDHSSNWKTETVSADESKLRDLSLDAQLTNEKDGFRKKKTFCVDWNG